MVRFRRLSILFAALIISFSSSAQSAASNSGYSEIQGHVRFGSTVVPGASITVTDPANAFKATAITGTEGKFTLRILANRKYIVRAEMPGFAPVGKEIMVSPSAPTVIEFDLVLISHAQLGKSGTVEQKAGSGTPDTAASQKPTVTAPSATNPTGQPDARTASLATSADATAGSVANSGEMGSAGVNVNDLHGQVYWLPKNSAFDAAPHALGRTPASKPEYSSNDFGVLLQGPLVIPKFYDGRTKTIFELKYGANSAASPSDVVYTHVPTEQERSGDFSQTVIANGMHVGQSVRIFDPTTGTIFARGQIPRTRLNPAAVALLRFLPLPNVKGNDQSNFRYSRSGDSDGNSLFLYMRHDLNPKQADNSVTSSPMRILDLRINYDRKSSNQSKEFPSAKGADFSRNLMLQTKYTRNGSTWPRWTKQRNNFGITLGYKKMDSNQKISYPALGGNQSGKELSGNIQYRFRFGKWTSSLDVAIKQEQNARKSAMAGVENLAGELNLNGVSQDPLDWGLPSLAFANYLALSDGASGFQRVQTCQITENMSRRNKNHNLEFGLDYKWQSVTERNNMNPRGRYLFSGFATADMSSSLPADGTGYDFADFLLGLPQQTSIQYSPNRYRFYSRTLNAFAQDSWRVLQKLTLELGVRYEYSSPVAEENNRIVNLDFSPDFTAVAAVFPGQVGPYSGRFPQTLVIPNRKHFVPRMGIAWRPLADMTVRAGYGIQYQLGQYQTIAERLAFQPPFSFTQTNIALVPGQLTLQNGFPTPSASTLTNSFGVDKNYRQGYVQTWNLSLQQSLRSDLSLNASYTGAKGTALDIWKAPNLGTPGSSGVMQPFQWLTSEGSSISHSSLLSLNLSRESYQTFLTYTFSKSIDNLAIPQNSLSLAGERSLSDNDQRHRLTSIFFSQLPFGKGKRWFSDKSLASAIFGGWFWYGNLSFASGRPYTARIIGNFYDLARGTSGTLRANYNGSPIRLDHPNSEQYFNTAAFSIPLPGQLGNAPRNSINGPPTLQSGMLLSKTMPIGKAKLSIAARSTNVLNFAQLAEVDTVANSPTFGKVTAMGGMRQIRLYVQFFF